MTDERTEPPLVAVVTPVYNGAEFLAEAMDCVQAQSYPNLVHVMLDNASTDATAEIIARYKNARVPVITARNDTLLSMDDNWNKALTLIPADAKYFTILCADDIIYPTGVALMAELAERDETVGAVTAAGFLNDRPREYGWPRDRDIFDGQEAIRMYFKTEVIFEARHALFRTARLAHAAPFFDSRTGHSSDIDAVLREIAHGKIGFVHAPVTMVREHAGNMSEQVMRPLASHFNDWQILLERYAPSAFNGTYKNLYRRYRRHYIQKLLRWRLVERNDRAFTWHRARLRETRRDFQAWEYADAGVDYVMKRLHLRDHWYKYP
jgi:glycosyltransferase involved in cell wall biosynthesis